MCHAATAFTPAPRTRASSSANLSAWMDPLDPSTPTTMVFILSPSFVVTPRFSARADATTSVFLRIGGSGYYRCHHRRRRRVWSRDNELDPRHDGRPDHAARRDEEAETELASATTPHTTSALTPMPSALRRRTM